MSNAILGENQVGLMPLGYIDPQSVTGNFEQFMNGESQTKLVNSINDSITTITVYDSIAFPSIPRFRIRIEDELCLVTTLNGNVWTVIRGIEGTNAVSHAANVNVNYVLTAGALDQFRIDSIQTGLESALPSYDMKPGMLYIPTDSLLMYRYNGSSWDTFGPNYRFAPPKLTDFIWDNKGSSVVDDAHGFIRIVPEINSGTQVRIAKKAAPTSYPYRVAGVFGCCESFGQYWGYGVCLRDSSNGKLITFGAEYWDSFGLIGNFYKWVTSTSGNSSYIPTTGLLLRVSDHIQSSLMWWSLYVTSTWIQPQFSFDGVNYYDYTGGISISDWCNPNEVGFFTEQSHASQVPSVSVFHWEP